MIYKPIIFHINFITNIIKEIEKIILNYNVYIRNNGDYIYYYKVVKSKYWHSLYYYYLELLDALNLPIDKKLHDKITLFIGVIPCLINIDIVKRKHKFNVFQMFYYDYIKN